MRIKGGNVEIGGPGKLLIKNAGIQKVGAQSVESAMKSFTPEEFNEWFVIKSPLSGKPIANQHYEITLPDGGIIKGVTDASGKTSLINSNAINDVKVKLLSSGD